MRTPLTKSLFLLAIFFGLAAVTNAQGVIVPGPCRRCPDGPRPAPLPRTLPVKSIKIDADIRLQVATTHVEQVFRNDTDATLEGTYFFPIPESAAISEFAIWDGDKRLVGEVRTREEARRIYDDIVRRQRDPGLLEYAGKDLFQASIFPIPPHSDKKLEITYTQVVRAESNTVAYRYPLGTGRQYTQIGTVAGTIKIESKEPLRNIYSPTNVIDVKNSSDRQSSVSFENERGKEPQDFQLFYTVSKDDFGLTLLTHREPGKDGYFLLMISPKNDWSEQEYSAKDIIFVIDTSGSMAEEGKMEKAKAALLYGVRILRSQDRFNIVSFAGEERLMETGVIAADDEGKKRGEQFVKSLKPVGGTNINQSLVTSLAQFRQDDRPKMLVFMTDGLPTVGETNVSRIIENIHKEMKPGIRLFTFGVGYDVNTALLNKLASDNGGVADYVDPKEDMEVKVSNFFTKINFPVLTDLKLDTAELKTDLIYPRTLPDLFRGSQVTLIGRYSNSSSLDALRLRLTGKSAGAARSYNYDNLRFPLREEGNDFLPRLWATRRVGWLMEQIRSNGESNELRDEVVDLGTRYGIVTPYTSYLSVEQRDAQQITAAPPPSSPGPRGFSGVLSRRPAKAAEPRPTVGAAAVAESKRERIQQEADKLDANEAPDSVRRVGSKTFYLRDGVWVDSDYKENSGLPESTLKFGSDEYFALLKQKSNLASYFALGERVLVVFEGRIYRVDAVNP